MSFTEALEITNPQSLEGEVVLNDNGDGSPVAGAESGTSLVPAQGQSAMNVRVTPSTESKAVTTDMTPINISKNSGTPSSDGNNEDVNDASTWNFYREYVAGDLVD